MCRSLEDYFNKMEKECPLEKPRVLLPSIQGLLQDYNNVVDDMEMLCDKMLSVFSMTE